LGVGDSSDTGNLLPHEEQNLAVSDWSLPHSVQYTIDDAIHHY